MRYTYEVKPVEGESKTLYAMSYKTVRVSYKNKKNHDLVKYVKIKAKAD